MIIHFWIKREQHLATLYVDVYKNIAFSKGEIWRFSANCAKYVA